MLPAGRARLRNGGRACQIRLCARREALTAQQTVSWLPGDEFEAKRLQSAEGL